MKSDLDAEWLVGAGFARSGAWVLNDERSRALFQGSVPREPGVYAYAADGVIRYVGSAQRGLRRRLRHYEIAENMRTAFRIRGEITKELLAGRRVEMLTIVPGPMQWNGLPIDPILGLEEGLIRHLRPEWNRRGLGRLKEPTIAEVPEALGELAT